jgi:hypothetical protein
MDPFLQLAEAERRAVGTERDDLSVEQHRLPRCPRLARRDDLGKLRRLVIAEARGDRDLGARRDRHERADPVVLRLVHEVGIVERRVGERRQHGADGSGGEMTLGWHGG